MLLPWSLTVAREKGQPVLASFKTFRGMTVGEPVGLNMTTLRSSHFYSKFQALKKFDRILLKIILKDI